MDSIHKLLTSSDFKYDRETIDFDNLYQYKTDTLNRDFEVYIEDIMNILNNIFGFKDLSYIIHSYLILNFKLRFNKELNRINLSIPIIYNISNWDIIGYIEPNINIKTWDETLIQADYSDGLHNIRPIKCNKCNKKFIYSNKCKEICHYCSDQNHNLDLCPLKYDIYNNKKS